MLFDYSMLHTMVLHVSLTLVAALTFRGVGEMDPVLSLAAKWPCDGEWSLGIDP